MKKQTERKGFSRLGLPVSGGSPGFTGMLINLLFILNTKDFFSFYIHTRHPSLFVPCLLPYSNVKKRKYLYKKKKMEFCYVAGSYTLLLCSI